MDHAIIHFKEKADRKYSYFHFSLFYRVFAIYSDQSCSKHYLRKNTQDWVEKIAHDLEKAAWRLQPRDKHLHRTPEPFLRRE